ncbi:MAG: MBL fold metallo-hydrolase, partial [Planctomycetota bacterium]|nr:MBL fold metallo-hydrolase [Planctomycetota bacterium]
MRDADATDAAIAITFRGVRGSHPMPGPTTMRYGGNTASQEIRVGGRLIVFDAGTGIISLGHELAGSGRPQDMALFFSHNHHDHLDGLLYFRPAYMDSTTVHIFGPAEERGDIGHALELLSRPAAHPVPLTRMGMRYAVTVLNGGERVAWRPGEPAPRLAGKDEKLTDADIVVKMLKNRLHPVDGVLNFRLEYGGRSYVYATDVEGDEEKGDAALAEFARDADVLAHDGQYMSEEYF